MVGFFISDGPRPFPDVACYPPHGPYAHDGHRCQHVVARLADAHTDRPFEVELARQSLQVIQVSFRGQRSLGKTHALQLRFGEPCGIIHHGVADVVSIAVLTVDHKVVGIEMEPVFIRKIGEVIYTHLQPYRDTFGQFLVEDGLCLYWRREPQVLYFDIQPPRKLPEDASRHRAVAEARCEVDLKERQVHEKKSAADTEYHGLG